MYQIARILIENAVENIKFSVSQSKKVCKTLLTDDIFFPQSSVFDMTPLDADVIKEHPLFQKKKVFKIFVTFSRIAK